jgi:LuxR family maltose regulon positive regulatory protein
MERAVRRQVTVVSGEPAAGKTSLAVDLLHSTSAADRLVAWLALPHLVDDELLFWRYLLAALDPLDVYADDLADRLADGESPDDEWLIVLANRLADVPGDSIIVIDDLHQLENARAFQALWSLLEHVPPRVHFVLISRSKPPFPLSEWKMSGRAEEIGSADLRYTREELCELVAASPDIELSDDAITQLLARTEGWAGGIKLALLSIRHADDPHAFVERFAADDELVSSYLFRGVLDRQDPDVRDFLLDISVLEFITAEICDAVRDRSDSDELLTRCRSDNLFFVDLPGPERCYRVHGLFAQLLRATLETRDPARAELLNRRASEVFERRGDVRSTVAHAVAAGDDVRIGSLIARYAGVHAHRGEWDEIASWVTLLRPRARLERPETIMALAITLGLTGGGAEALDLLDSLTDAGIQPRLAYAAEQLRGLVLMAKGEVNGLSATVERLRQAAPDGDFVLPFDEIRLAEYLAGSTAYLSGDMVAAREACERATERRPRPSLFYVESPGWLARVACAEGRLSESRRLAEESLARHTEIRSGETAVSVPAMLALADVAWERDDLDECERQLTLAGRTVRPLFWERVLIESASSRLRASRGDLAGAVDNLDEVGKVYLTGSVAPQLRAIVSQCLVDVALRAGDVAEALRWESVFESCGLGPLPAALRLGIAAASGPADLESRVETALDRPQQTPSRISTLLAAADVMLLNEEPARADQLIAEATALAEPEGFVRRFGDATPQVRKAVLEAAAGPADSRDDQASEFFLRVLSTAISASPARPFPSSPSQSLLVDELTDREHEVLGLLIDGRSYSDIGTTLFVSRNTVKSHVRHIYTKLGVSSRSDAAAEAARIGLA